ncbi:MAG: glutamine-hydrolyzing GMP synthase [Gammaproteobacteria bacterium]|nr:glutamine-hydrolyzing GMP synthase [Gammaproteobacteria bacterium]MCH9743839.1 glutamine-hydrolyzing GMP synthase [Gammaproteobacteria bacterium]
MAMDIHQYKILILDFGSQYTQLIARRVREIGVYCELMDCRTDADTIRAFNPNGVILSGSPESVTAHDTPRIPECVFELKCPVLGICYGMQSMCHQFGGKVASSGTSEFGSAKVKVETSAGLFDDHTVLEVWMSHGDKVIECPRDFNVIAHSENDVIAAIANVEKHYYGLQFHPEVTHTRQGAQILERFVCDICGCEKNWFPSNIIEDSIQQIHDRVGDDEVLVALSGGVDSAVVAAIIHKAIGDRLTCVFVDTGLLRKNEGDQVMQVFAEHMGVKVIRVDAEKQFLDAIKGIEDPEEKRKRCGETFIRVFEQQAENLQGIRWLGQGTIYPDVIESASAKTGGAHVIKSHHNVGGLPEDFNFELIEPLRELFKDEVRRIGLELGLPSHLVFRHPFPGPGLALRVLGEIKPEFLAILRDADAIFIEELRKHDHYQNVSQAFAVFLPIKSVGVKGDARCYEYVIALRCVTTVDFMTAHWSDLPYDFLSHVSHRIINEIQHVSRVVYDISGKPPATIEWE